MFSSSAEAHKKMHDNAQWCANLSNLAIVQIRRENAKDAVRNARSAIDVAQKVYVKQCQEVSSLCCFVGSFAAFSSKC